MLHHQLTILIPLIGNDVENLMPARHDGDVIDTNRSAGRPA